MYQSFEPAGLTALPWTKMSWHRDPSQDLGLTFVGNASIALDELEGTRHVVGVRALGAATVGGVATTRYEVSTAPVCKPVHPSTVVETQGPSFVWVDAKGRLVQVTGSLRVGGHLPAAVRGTFRSARTDPSGDHHRHAPPLGFRRARAHRGPDHPADSRRLGRVGHRHPHL